MDSTKTVFELNDRDKFKAYIKEYDLLIPGGVKALEKLRQENAALLFINEWDKKKKVINQFAMVVKC